MIGIDIARIKRWFVKNYTTYATTNYKVVVTVLSQTAIDTSHSLDGVTLNFTVTVYNAETNAVVVTCSGVYNRMHYGGWNASATADPTPPASLQDDVNDGNESSGVSDGENDGESVDLSDSENNGSDEPSIGG